MSGESHDESNFSNESFAFGKKNEYIGVKFKKRSEFNVISLGSLIRGR